MSNVTKEGIEVKVGQVWRDLDKRMGTRERMVVAIEDGRAVIAFPWDPSNGRTKILISRMHYHSTGWELLREAA